MKETADDILNILLEEQKIVKVTEDMYTLTEYMERAKELIQEHLKGGTRYYDRASTRYV